MDDTELLLAVSADGVGATSVPAGTLKAAGLMERQHLQEWVIAHPEILGQGVMVVAVEYDGWMAGSGAQRDRLDVLGLDVDGRLVVAELKRGPAPDTVDMQAIKYAAMASQFKVETLATAYASYRAKRGATITVEAAADEISTHAPATTDETLANPRLVVIAQSFSPSVISSVVWLAKRGLTIALTRFQPYQLEDGRVLVTFSRLFPLPTLEDSIVAPGTPTADIPVAQLPVVEWHVEELVALGRIANPTARTVLDMCSERADSIVSLTEIVDAAGITRSAARGQLAGLTMVIKSRFKRRNWPFVVKWAADGTQQASYTMSASMAGRWLEAARHLEAENSDVSPAAIDDDETGI